MLELKQVAQAWVDSGRPYKDFSARLRAIPAEKRSDYLNKMGKLFGLEEEKKEEAAKGRSGVRTFTPDDPSQPVQTFTPDEPEVSQAAKQAELAKGSMGMGAMREGSFGYVGERQTSAPGEESLGESAIGGFIAGATGDQIQRVDGVSEALDSSKETNPISYGAGKFVGFVFGPGKIFNLSNKVVGATRAMKYLNSVTKAGSKAPMYGKFLAGAAKTAVAATEVGAIETGLEAAKPGVSADQALSTGTEVAGWTAGLFGAFELTKATFRKISPKWASIMDGLDEAVKVKRQGSDKAAAEAVTEANKLVASVRGTLNTHVQKSTDDISNAFKQTQNSMDESLLAIEEGLTNAAQSKIKDARGLLQESASQVLGVMKWGRRSANQVYKKGLESLPVESLARPVQSAKLYDDAVNQLQKAGLVLVNSKGKLVPNMTNPYVKENSAEVMDLLQTVASMPSANNVRTLNTVKQVLADKLDFASKATTGGNYHLRQVYDAVRTHLDDTAPELKRLNQAYHARRVALDEAAKASGMSRKALEINELAPDTGKDLLARKLEASLASGKKAGSTSRLEESLARLGELDPAMQKATQKALHQASEVVKLTSLDVADIPKTRTLLKRALLNGDALSTKQLKQVQENIGKIEATDDVVKALKGRDMDGLPFDFTELTTKEGADAARKWVDDYAPKAKDSLERLIRQSKRYQRVEKLIPQIDTAMESALLQTHTGTQLRALKLLVKIEPRFAPLFDKGKLLNALGKKGALEIDAPLTYQLVQKAFALPQETAILLKRMGIPIGGKEFHIMWNNIVSVLNESEPEEQAPVLPKM